MNRHWNNYKWLYLISALVIVFTTIPYILGFNYQNEYFKFSGFIIGVEDGNSYIAKMLLGSNGKWLFTTPYTAYDQIEFFAFFPYLVLGKIAADPELRLQLIIIFHLFRISGIVFLVFETFQFSYLFIRNKKSSLITTFFVVCGGGLGWLGILFPEIISGRLPLEFYSPETFGFLSAFSLPHLLFGRAFLFRSMRTYLQETSFDHPTKSEIIISGVYLLISGIFQPLNLFIGWFVVGIYRFSKFIKTKEKFSKLLDIGYWILPSAPLFFYNFFLFQFDPYLSSWQSQNKIFSPPLIDYLLAYGLGIIALMISIVKKWTGNINFKNFLYIWIILLPIMIYLPVNTQRRLSEGVWICFCIFLSLVIQNFKYKVFKITFGSLMIFPTLLFLLGSINTVKNINIPVYIPASMEEMTKSIKNQFEFGDVVLAPFYESNVLPSYLPIKVLSGHGPESMNFIEISNRIDSFYNGMSDEYMVRELIAEFNIKFIVIPRYYQNEKVIKQLSYFSNFEIYESDDYSVIRINEK